MVARVHACSTALESAGEALMKRQSVPAIGTLLRVAGEELRQLSPLLAQLSSSAEDNNNNAAAQRCNYAAERMVAAGTSLLPASGSSNQPKAMGKSWIKGGS